MLLLDSLLYYFSYDSCLHPKYLHSEKKKTHMEEVVLIESLIRVKVLAFTQQIMA